jgi:AraC-like DNA-binding protein
LSGLAVSLLLGSLHSIALAIALRRRARNRHANAYLAALLGALSLLLFNGFLRAAGVLAAYPHLIGVTAWVPFVLGPLVFLYVREMTAAEPAALAPRWRHGIVPVAAVLLLAITFYPRSASFKRAIGSGQTTWLGDALEVALLVHGIAYAIAALVLLRRHRRQVQQLYSNLRGVDLRWLFALAVLNALVWIAALVAYVIRAMGVGETSAVWAIVPLGSTLTVFVIGYFQLGQAEIYVVPPRVDPGPPAVPEAPEALRAVPAYERARLADDDAAELERRITAAMTDQHLYRRAGLTLAELADEVAATPHEVSQVLSTRLGRNFYTFVNEHRIRHVQDALASTDRPVLDLALEAGFQSKSTFNSAFRKATGTTPSEYRQRVTAGHRSARAS